MDKDLKQLFELRAELMEMLLSVKGIDVVGTGTVVGELNTDIEFNLNDKSYNLNLTEVTPHE